MRGVYIYIYVWVLFSTIATSIITIPATVGPCHFTTFVSVPLAATIIAIGTATTTAIMAVMVVAERHHDYGGVSNDSGCNVVVLGEVSGDKMVITEIITKMEMTNIS